MTLLKRGLSFGRGEESQLSCVGQLVKIPCSQFLAWSCWLKGYVESVISMPGNKRRVKRAERAQIIHLCSAKEAYRRKDNILLFEEKHIIQKCISVYCLSFICFESLLPPLSSPRAHFSMASIASMAVIQRKWRSTSHISETWLQFGCNIECGPLCSRVY